MIKKIILVLIVLFFLASGCTSPKNKEKPKAPEVPEATHLTVENNGLLLSVTPKLRSLPALDVNAKEGNEIKTLQVTVDNNSKDPVPVSPAFITLEGLNGDKYKFSPDLTLSVAKGSAFKEVSLPPGYRGGGLLIFEFKKGTEIKYLLYDDSAGHKMRLQFPSKSEQV